MFLSHRKRLMGDASTSSYEAFHSKINDSVPGRLSYLKRALKRLCVEMLDFDQN